MVTTRSAEKRLAAAGRVEQLAVRPKLSESPATPTPLPSNTKKFSKTFTGISSTSQTASDAAPQKLSPKQAASESSGGDDDDDDLSYLTAKESPDSYRDAQSLLLDNSIIATPSVRPVRSQPGSKLQPTGLSSTTSRRYPVSSLPANTDIQASESMLGHTGNIIHSQSCQQAGTEDKDKTNVEATVVASARMTEPDDDLDGAPEVLSSKKATKSRRLAGPGSQKHLTTRSNQRDLLRERYQPVAGSAVSKETGQPAMQSQEQNVTDSTTTKAPIQSPSISSHTLVGDMDADSPQIVRNDRARSIPLHARSLRASPRSAISLDNHQPQVQFSTNNPLSAANSLESFRQRVLNDRAAVSSKKRGRGFTLTDDWSTKRRKFVVT